MDSLLGDRLSDPWWRLNNLYKIKNEYGEVVPFRPKPEQTFLYDNLWYLNIILKARQLGMTTFIQIFMLDRCLFNDNVNAGIVAHTKDDAEAFFADKIKFAYDNLPEDLKRLRPATSDSARHLRFSNGSQIRVGTSLRSGTYQYVHVSEFGKMCAQYPEKAQEVITGTLNTVAPGQFVWIESTAEGAHGPFYEMCQRAERLAQAVDRGEASLTKLDYKFFFFPWFTDPRYTLEQDVEIPEKFQKYFEELRKEHGIALTRKQKNWYVKKAEEQGGKMRQEFPSTPAEAFERETEVQIYGKQLRKAYHDGRITKLPIERGVPVNTFWDLGRNDVCAIWFHQEVGAQHRFIYYYENRLQDLTFYVEQLQRLKELYHWLYGRHYLPHDVEVTDISSHGNRSRRQVLEDAGLTGIVVVPRIRHLNDGIELVRRDFDSFWFDEEGCEVGLRALEGYEWVWDDVHKTTRKTPSHNWASNGADAIRQFSQGYRGRTSSFKAQAERVAGARNGAYTRRKSTRGTVFNPTLDHVV